MDTTLIYLYSLHNEEHFQFGEDLIELITRTGVSKLKIQEQFDAFAAVHSEEDEVLEQIRKSDLTAQMDAADRARDAVFRGLADANLSALNHFRPTVADAARRVQIVLDTYGNIAKRGYAEETGAAYNLATELMQKHEEDIRLLGLDVWAEELLTRNKVVAELLRKRDTEYTGEIDVRMKDVRKQADAAYRTLTRLVEAFGLVAEAQKSEDAEMYREFVRSLNKLIDRYKTILSQRRGRAAKKKPEDAKPKPDAPAVES